MTARPGHPVRPFMPADTMALRDLFAASIDELTADDYDEDQRIAWASMAEDAQALQARLSRQTTLVVMSDGDYAGFASLKMVQSVAPPVAGQDAPKPAPSVSQPAVKAGAVVDMLYVHPFFVREGVGSALADALERIAAGRGAAEITVEASDTAVDFFAGRGYVAELRNTLPIDDQWLANTTMKKVLKPASPVPAPGKLQ